jgi:hypothetical protein
MNLNLSWKNLANYVPLAIGILFVGFLLYGTYRRTEEFTTMRGDFPPFLEVQRNVRSIFDQYYDYDLSKFSAVSQVDVYNMAKKMLAGNTANYFEMTQSQIHAFIVQITDPSKLQNVSSETRTMLNDFKTFLPAGFTLNLDTLPIDTHMALLHAGRDWLSSKIRAYKQGDKFPIEQMILSSLALDAFTRVFKNAVIGGYFAMALQASNPKPKKV